MIYLDNSSTTRQFDEVTDLIAKAGRETFGNPSSLHTLGYDAFNAIETARKGIENFFYGNGDLIFTSGGTESDNTAIFSVCRKMRRRGNKIITTNVEHPAVLEVCKRLVEDGFVVEQLKVDVDGYVEPQALKSALDDNTILVSMMAVNNEVGTIEPVLPAYNIVNEYNWAHNTGILFHTDAVQAFGKIRFDDAPFDLISVSAHKIHGPKGVGALYMKKDLKLPPFILGGGQERGYRSTTENVPGIAGFGLAAEMTYDDMEGKQRQMAAMNEYLYKGLTESIPDVEINGPREIGSTLFDHSKRCPSVLNVSFMDTRAEVILHTLEQDGIFVSTGSACSSNKAGDSHVLRAMSMDHKEIEGAIRFSFSETNTMEEMDEVIERVKTAVGRFRKLGSFR